MNKKNIFTITGFAAGTVIGIATAIIVIKRISAKKNRVAEDSIMIDINDYNEVSIDDDVEDTLIDSDMLVQNFMQHLMANGIGAEEVASICETITRIKMDLPDQFIDVSQKMVKLMETEFDLGDIIDFDRENFKLMYSSVDPCQLFVSNGFKILALGCEYQDAMMSLGDALTELQENNPNEAIHVIYEIYHIFNDIDVESITSDTFEEKFKPYVDKYVSIQPEICDAADVDDGHNDTPTNV